MCVCQLKILFLIYLNREEKGILTKSEKRDLIKVREKPCFPALEIVEKNSIKINGGRVRSVSVTFHSSHRSKSSNGCLTRPSLLIPQRAFVQVMSCLFSSFSRPSHISFVSRATLYIVFCLDSSSLGCSFSSSLSNRG